MRNIPETATQRWGANIKALRILKELEDEGRNATPAEQETISHFSGFGDSDFNKAFQTTARRGEDAPDDEHLTYRPYDRWAVRGDELRDLMDEEEYKDTKQARLTAFYTSPEVVKAMWDGVSALGADKAESLRILEPSAGSGRFIKWQPEHLKACLLYTSPSPRDS